MASWFDNAIAWVEGTTPQSTLDAQDAQINALNNQLVGAGFKTQDQADAAAQDIAAGNVSTGANDAAASVGSEFDAGLAQGAQNVLTAPGKAIGLTGQAASTLLGGILKNIPWWVWLAGVGALFVWMGGLELLKGRLARYK